MGVEQGSLEPRVAVIGQSGQVIAETGLQRPEDGVDGRQHWALRRRHLRGSRAKGVEPILDNAQRRPVVVREAVITQIVAVLRGIVIYRVLERDSTLYNMNYSV